MGPRLSVGLSYAMLCVIWGSTWLAIKIGLTGAPPFLAASLRFLLAYLILVPILAWRRSPLPRTRPEWGLVAGVGVLLYTLDYGLIYWAEQAGVESGLASILFATFVFQTAIFAQILLPAEKLTIPKLAGIGLGFVGILVIFRGELATAGVDRAFPMLAIVLAATCAAISSVATKRWGGHTDPVSFTALSMAFGAAGLLGLSLAAREPWAAPTWPEGVLTIAYLAIFGSVVAFVTYWWLLKQIQATTASYIGMVTPVVAVLLGFSVGGEVFDIVALGGAALTLVGIYLSSRGFPSRRRSPTSGAAPDPPAK